MLRFSRSFGESRITRAFVAPCGVPRFGRAVLLGVFAVWSAVLLSPAVAQTGQTRSQLVLEEETFDFGSVPQGTIVKHDFVLTNKGNAPFTIQRVAPSCGCTASTPEKDTVAPGERVPIHVSFDTTGFSGEKLKTVRVFTSDFDRPTVLLTVRGTVLPEVLLEPAQLLFEDVVRGQGAPAQEVKVRIREGSKSELTTVQSFSPYIKVEERVTGPRERVLAISLDPQTPRGELRERVVIGVKGSTETSLNVPVFASVRGSLRLRPQTISFGVLEGTAPVERAVQLDNVGPRDLTIVGVQSNNPAVVGSVKAVKPGKNFVVTVRVDPTKVQRDLRAVLEVKTDNEEEQSVALNVFGILPPRS